MKQLEEKFSKLHIAVIGDIMIDRYFFVRSIEFHLKHLYL